MKASLRILILAIAVGLPPSAFAADYDPPIVVDQPVEDVPVEVGSGWYLRGDIGYNFDLQADGDFDFRTSIRYRDLQPRRLRYGLARGTGHLGCRLRLQFHRYDPRRRRRSTGSAPTLTAPRRARDPLLCGDPRLCRHELPFRGQRRSGGAELHGQRLCRSRHLCRLHALCRRRPRLHLHRLGHALRQQFLRRRRSRLPGRHRSLPAPRTTASRAGGSPMPRWRASPTTSRRT